MLTYAEELALSDPIYERRALRKILRDSGQERDKEFPRNAEEQEIWDRGKEATRILVEHYTPFACVLARGALSKVKDHHFIEYTDLVSIAILAMMDSSWAFDPRGSTRGVETPTEDHRMGLRFSSYCKLRVLKELHRFINKQSTPYYVSVDVISSTWAFLAIQEDLTAKANGAKVPIEDVERASGIRAGYIEARLPTRSEFSDVEMLDIQDSSSVEAAILGTSDTYLYNGFLEQVLSEFFNEESVRIFLCYLGLDIDTPRETKEVGKLLGLSTRYVNIAISDINDALRHPQNRVRIQRFINRLSEEQGITV